jgi:DUF971 family protein
MSSAGRFGAAGGGAEGSLAYNGRVTRSPTLSPTVPVRIHADRPAATLQIDWQDGHRTVYDFVSLRWLCPCAFCRGEAGLPGWLDSRPTLTPPQTQMVDIQLVGSYAVAPSWADGHHTGYYTFAVLRDRCPCPECTARRASSPTAARASGHLSHAAEGEDSR